MAGFTVNIADFRCRGIDAWATSTPRRPGNTSCTLVVVEPRAQTSGEEIYEATRPPVFDIGVARAAQRLRHRAVFRPIPIQRRRENVIGFAEGQVRAMRAQEGFRTSPFDFPPAA